MLPETCRAGPSGGGLVVRPSLRSCAVVWMPVRLSALPQNAVHQTLQLVPTPVAADTCFSVTAMARNIHRLTRDVLHRATHTSHLIHSPEFTVAQVSSAILSGRLFLC